MSLEAQVTLSVVSQESGSAGLAQSMRVAQAAYSQSFVAGTGAGQAQVSWTDARTLAGASETLNLSALAEVRSGSVATVNMTAVKALYVRNTGTAALSVAGAPFPSGGVTIAPGGCVAQVDPTAGGMAASGVTVTGSAGGTYDIVLLGEGAVS